MNNIEIDKKIAYEIMGFEEWSPRKKLYKQNGKIIDFSPSNNVKDAFDVLNQKFRNGMYDIDISIGEDVVMVNIIDLISDEKSLKTYRAVDSDIAMVICKAVLLTID